MAALQDLYRRCQRLMPPALGDWEQRVDACCDEYRIDFGEADLVEFDLRLGVYVFDQRLERVLLAYAGSRPELHARDKSRMRGFPDVNVSVRAALGENGFVADRGHFLGHVCGGELDVNLFPQARRLNRGWSSEG